VLIDDYVDDMGEKFSPNKAQFGWLRTKQEDDGDDNRYYID
jgi:hypothetical protein